MAITDPVSDFLTGIRNALRAKHRRVDVPASKMKTEIAKLLLRERFINNYKLIDDQRQGVLRIYLKYGPDEGSVITGIRRMSTPGRRRYVGKDDIPKVMGGLGLSVVSTSKGIMTDREAREAGLGGELVCQVW